MASELQPEVCQKALKHDYNNVRTRAENVMVSDPSMNTLVYVNAMLANYLGKPESNNFT